jgi:hypothetical protein
VSESRKVDSDNWPSVIEHDSSLFRQVSRIRRSARPSDASICAGDAKNARETTFHAGTSAAPARALGVTDASPPSRRVCASLTRTPMETEQG